VKVTGSEKAPRISFTAHWIVYFPAYLLSSVTPGATAIVITDVGVDSLIPRYV